MTAYSKAKTTFLLLSFLRKSYLKFETMEKLGYVLLCILTCSISSVLCQQLSSEDDKIDLDTIQAELEKNVKEAKEELVENAKIIQTVTENYATAKLSQNIFKVAILFLSKVLGEKYLWWLKSV